MARRHGSRRFRHNRCVDSTLALPFLQGMCIHDHSPCPEGEHQSSSLLCYINSADEHNCMPSNALFRRGLDNSNAYRATSHGRGFGNIAYRATSHGRGLEIYHFNALFWRGFGEYIVTLVKLRKGCMRQTCSAPDTLFVSLPLGERNLQATLSVDNAFEWKRKPRR
jgi:hypothetical protein